jgi:uncharacterized membrane protein
MMRLAFLTVLGVLIGGIVHVLSLLMVPPLASQDAYSRLEAVSPVNRFSPPPPDEARAMPFLDPAFSYRLCRYDVSASPLRLRLSVPGVYFSVAFHARDSVIYFALNDRSSVDGQLDLLLHDAASPLPDAADVSMPEGTIPVASPTLNGLVVVRAFVPSASHRAQVDGLLDRSQCLPLVNAGIQGGAAD